VNFRRCKLELRRHAKALTTLLSTHTESMSSDVRARHLERIACAESSVSRYARNVTEIRRRRATA